MARRISPVVYRYSVPTDRDHLFREDVRRPLLAIAASAQALLHAPPVLSTRSVGSGLGPLLDSLDDMVGVKRSVLPSIHLDLVLEGRVSLLLSLLLEGRLLGHDPECLLEVARPLLGLAVAH